jgi:hypothetical protein
MRLLENFFIRDAETNVVYRLRMLWATSVPTYVKLEKNWRQVKTNFLGNLKILQNLDSLADS